MPVQFYPHHDVHGLLHHPFYCHECALVAARKTAATSLATFGIIASFSALPTPLNVICAGMIVVATLSYLRDHNPIPYIFRPQPEIHVVVAPRSWYHLGWLNPWGTRIPTGNDFPSPPGRSGWLFGSPRSAPLPARSWFGGGGSPPPRERVERPTGGGRIPAGRDQRTTRRAASRPTSDGSVFRGHRERLASTIVRPPPPRGGARVPTGR